MKKLGIVQSVNHNKIKVRMFKNSACEKCHMCSEDKKFENEIEFDTKIKLNPGDEISFEIKEKDILSLGILIYTFPLISFFLFYFISSIFTDKELFKILFSFSGIIFSFIIIFFIDKFKGKKIIEEIVVINKQNEEV